MSSSAASNQEIIVCKDGTFTAELNVITHLHGAAARAKILRSANLTSIKADINAYLLLRDDGVTMVDTGVGSAWGNQYGHARGTLAKLGVQAADVKQVLLTHFHHDHVLGLLENGKPYFGNAVVFIPRAEADYLTHSPASNSYARIFKEVLECYGDHRVRLFNSGEWISKDLRSIPLPGHSPGHTGYFFNGMTDRAFLCGDIYHMPELQVHTPEIGVTFDFDAAQAAQSRMHAQAIAKQEKIKLGGGHTPGFLQLWGD